MGEVLRQPFLSKNFAADPVVKRTVLRLSENPTSAEKGSDARQKARFVHARILILAGPLVKIYMEPNLFTKAVEGEG